MIERETISAHEISGIMNGSTAGRSCGGFIKRETHACI